MNYVEAALSGLLMGTIMALSVGPTLFAILKYCMQYGFRAGVAFVLGVSISDFIYVILANLATEWMSFLNTYQREIGLVGAVVFMAIGVISFAKKTVPKRSLLKNEATMPSGVFFKIWLSGFAMNAFNPAVTLTWIFSMLKTVTYGPAEKAFFYTSCLVMVLSLDFMKAFFANKIRMWLSLRKIILVNKLSAILIFIFGIGLLFNALYVTH